MQYTAADLQTIAAVYSGIIFVVGIINNFLVQPWNRVMPGDELVFDFRFWRRAWWRRDNKAKKLDVRGVFQDMKRFEMWGETLFYSANLLLLTHYLSVSAQLMFEKGDVALSTEPNSPTDYMYTRLVGWINALGFLWFPLVQVAVKNLKWWQCFLMLFISGFLVILVVAVPYLEAQVIGMLLLACTRLQLFSFHRKYIIHKMSFPILFWFRYTTNQQR